MNKNYYDILEVNKNASPEIIEKAYKTLVKKYHPDLQEGDLKFQYEEKLKIINEAYEILSNEEKRRQYDFELENSESDLLDENMRLRNEINQMKNHPYNQPNSTYSYDNTYNENQYQNNNQNQNIDEQYQQEFQEAVEKAYYDAYIQDLRNRGYKIKYKKTLKDYLYSFISILIVILILFILWQIPFVKNYFINLYNNNSAFKFIIDIFISIFNTFKQ